MDRTVFNKAQLEMLDIMAGIRSEEELEELKHVISEFYARRADEELDKLWQSGEWNEQTLKELGELIIVHHISHEAACSDRYQLLGTNVVSA